VDIIINNKLISTNSNSNNEMSLDNNININNLIIDNNINKVLITMNSVGYQLTAPIGYKM
jgi:hypothetical protein